MPGEFAITPTSLPSLLHFFSVRGIAVAESAGHSDCDGGQVIRGAVL